MLRSFPSWMAQYYRSSLSSSCQPLGPGQLLNRYQRWVPVMVQSLQGGSKILLSHPVAISRSFCFTTPQQRAFSSMLASTTIPPSPQDAALKRCSRIPAPTSQQLWNQFLGAAVPMVGFGFIDNFIMLQAGELLDASIGVTFGLATLTAAAVGQIFSDVSGVGMGGLVEAVAGRHLPPAGLSEEQRRLGICRIVLTAGRMIGVISGCLLGMTSLLFMDLEESQRLRRFKELQPILTTIIRHTKRLAKVSTCRIYLLGINEEGEEVLFEVGLSENGARPKQQQLYDNSQHPPSSSRSSLFLSSSSIRSFSHHFNRHHAHNSDAHRSSFFSLSSCSPSQLPSQSSHSHPSPLPSQSSCLQCVRMPTPRSPIHDCLNPHENKPQQAREHHSPPHPISLAEPIVRYVVRTGEAIMCERHQPLTNLPAPSSSDRGKGGGNGGTVNKVTAITTSSSVHTQHIPYTENEDSTVTLFKRLSSDQILLLAPTSPVHNSVLCYPVFDDMDRDRVIGVIELADKVPTDPTDREVFTREDERLVRMLSEHLSLYLAMTNYRNANVTEDLESVEKIGYVCPEI